MSHLTESQLDQLKKSLLDEKQDLEEHFDEIGNGPGLDESLRDSTGELSAADNHPADVGTEVFERSRDLAIDDNLDHQLNQINHALDLMDSGDYGKCEVCGQEIPFERLEALPYTTFCIEHTPEKSISERRAIEEEVMTLPPKGAGEYRQQDAGRFDDADAWHTVEEYGNSDSPAMAAKRNVDNYDEIAADTTPDED